MRSHMDECVISSRPTQRALAIDEASKGTDNPKVAIRLNNLASLLQATKHLVKAGPLMRRMAGTLIVFLKQ